jgi:hypothetical protein
MSLSNGVRKAKSLLFVLYSNVILTQLNLWDLLFQTEL